MKSTRSAIWAALVASVLCGVAILDFPYGFYMLVRCITCGAAIYLLVTSKDRIQGWQVFVLIVVFLVFNPIWKTHLGRELWRIVDGATAVFFLSIGKTLAADAKG